MRYDQSMRVLKQILDRGELGEIVFAQIDMHAIPHWQPFLEDYDRLTLLQHERPPSRRAALPLRRSRRDHHADPQGSAYRLRARRRHHRLDAAVPVGRDGRLDRGRLVRTARGGLRRTTSTSAGGSRAPRASPRARSAGRPGAASTLTLRLDADEPAANGSRRRWDTMWFPHAFIGRHGAAPARASRPAPTPAHGRRQRPDDGAGRGRLPLDRGGPDGPALRDSTLTQRNRENDTMMHVGIFTGYFPYGLQETAKKIRGLGFNTVQLDLHFKDIDLSAGQITEDKASRSATRSATTTCRSAASPAIRTSFIPTRPSARSASTYLKKIIRNARHFGTPYVISETGTLQHRVGLGPPSEEQDRGGLRGVPQGHRATSSRSPMTTARSSCSRPTSTTSSARSRRRCACSPQVDHPGLGLLMDPTNYFETHNIDDMDEILNQVFDTLSDKIRIAHAKDVKRVGRRQIGEACRHRRRRRAREPHLPRRRRDRAAGARPRLAELRPLPPAAGREASQHPDDHRASRRRTTCRGRRNSSTASCARTGSESPPHDRAVAR